MNDCLTSKKSSSIVKIAKTHLYGYIGRIKSITLTFCGSYTHIYIYIVLRVYPYVLHTPC